MLTHALFASLIAVLFVAAVLALVLVKALAYRAWEIADMEDGEFPRPVVLPGQLVANHSMPPSGCWSPEEAARNAVEAGVFPLRAKRSKSPSARTLEPGPYAA